MGKFFFQKSSLQAEKGILILFPALSLLTKESQSGTAEETRGMVLSVS